MDIRLPKTKKKKSASTEPKTDAVVLAKPAHLRRFLPKHLGQCWPMRWPGQHGPFSAEQKPIVGAPAELGSPLSVSEVAVLIGCSPWTVRQTLIPRGLPYCQFKANGRLIFYRDQVIRWIEEQQEGGF